MGNDERLKGGDALFLDAETPRTTMQIGLCMIFERAAGDSGERSAPDPDRLIGLIESHLGDHPRYRKRIAYSPIEQWPIWVDDPDFDSRRHVHYARLAPGSDDAGLRDRCADFLSEPMDFDHPLWTILVLEGFAPDRFALVVKAHHCLADGIAGIEILRSLLDPEPRGDFVSKPLPRLESEPDRWSLLRADLADRARALRDLADELVAAARHPVDVVERVLDHSIGWLNVLEMTLKPTGWTVLDAAMGPERQLEWIATDLERIREIRRHRGGTLNDVVLATLALAIGRFLETSGIPRDEQASTMVRAAIPVNMRADHGHDGAGNQISLIFAALPIAERDPLVVLDETRAVLNAAKASHTSEALGFVLDLAEWTPRVLARSLTRLVMTRAHPANLVVTNIPGPKQRLYLLDSPLLSAYPIVPLMPGQAMTVAVLSYAGRLYWAFHADAQGITALSGFSKEVERAFEEIHGASTKG